MPQCHYQPQYPSTRATLFLQTSTWKRAQALQVSITPRSEQASTHAYSYADTDQPSDIDEKSLDVPPFKALSFLDRFLVIWIILAMAVGIILSNLVPSTAPALQQSTFVGVSVPIAVGLLVMMYPILCKVRYETVSFPLTLLQRSIS